MKEVYWGYWLILLGVFITIVMMMISNVTTSSTQDYYLIKEVTEASMLDAVDLAVYRESGTLKINQEKFVESFIRRFSENVNITKTYYIDFYDIMEKPPKVSVKVSSKSSTFTIAGDSQTFNLISKVDAILELPRGEEATGTTPSSDSTKSKIVLELGKGIKAVSYKVNGRKKGTITKTKTIECNVGDVISYTVTPKKNYLYSDDGESITCDTRDTTITFSAIKKS